MMKNPSFEIIAGTYEEFLLGYKFSKKHSELVQSFATHNHSASIRSLAVSGYYAASGAADDRIIIYDLKSRKEHCMLTHHNATINCLKFTPNHSHLISGSADGVLAIVRVGNWQLEKVWEKAHKGSAILDIAVHPSGKLALTLGSDCSLRTWNLIKGRQAYIINLNSKSKDARSLDKIIWAEDGIRFVLFGGRYTEIWSIESGGIIKSIEHNSKVNSCIWLSGDAIVAGYENGQIALVTINDDNKTIQQAHEARVKALAKFNKWVISASSGGEIKVWTKDLQELAKQDSGCRITYVEVMPSLKVKKEESEDILEVAEEQTLTNTVKKSSVVVEIEGSDNENAIFDEPDKKTVKFKVEKVTVSSEKKVRKHKLDRNQETEGNEVKKKKRNKRHSETNEDLNTANLANEDKIKIKKKKVVLDAVVNVKSIKMKNKKKRTTNRLIMG